MVYCLRATQTPRRARRTISFRQPLCGKRRKRAYLSRIAAQTDTKKDVLFYVPRSLYSAELYQHQIAKFCLRPLRTLPRAGRRPRSNRRDAPFDRIRIRRNIQPLRSRLSAIPFCVLPNDRIPPSTKDPPADLPTTFLKGGQFLCRGKQTIFLQADNLFAPKQGNFLTGGQFCTAEEDVVF